jgi:uncharacterized protein (DUF1800 family)
MDRRAFLKASKKKTVSPDVSSFKVARTNSGINPYTGTFGTNEIIHLLKRTMFGAKKTDVDYFRNKTLSQAVDELLTFSSTPPAPPLKNYENSANASEPDNAVLPGTTWVNVPCNDILIDVKRRRSVKDWWIGLIMNQERNIKEKLVLFWHNHFSTLANDVSVGLWIYQNNVTLRTHALGNFKQFAKQITLDPAMLKFQNGYLNSNTAPDENYGRELQELFTVGKGVNNASPPYTENDVKAAAKVLTGWDIGYDSKVSSFVPARHDSSNKQFSSFYNNTVITGRSGSNGQNELDDLLNMIFTTNDVALFICRKLYRWFVYYDIDAVTESNVIVPLAQIFRNNNYEIKPVLSTLLKSEHFFDVLNQSNQIKSPLDFTMGLCREFNVISPADNLNAYKFWELMRNIAAALGQDLGDPPNVAGWEAYYQAPQFSEIWINSTTFPLRNQFSDFMVSSIDFIVFAKSLSNPSDPNALISDSITYLFRLPLSQTSKNQIKTSILLSGQTQDHYWTDAWTAYMINPNDAMNAGIVKTRLSALYQYLMKLPEYQLA